MRDLRVISAKVVLRVTSIAPIRGFWPPSILLTGTGLQKTVEVELNGMSCPEFIVQDDRHVVARIPESQIGQMVTSIRAYAELSATYPEAAVTLGVTRPLKAISGIDRLVQAFLLLFLTNPKSDIFSPDSGGGARALIGKTTDAGHQGAAADLALCIDRTKSELMRVQTQTPGLPLEERLLSASLSSISFDANTSTLLATVTLDSMAGATAQLALR